MALAAQVRAWLALQCLLWDIPSRRISNNPHFTDSDPVSAFAIRNVTGEFAGDTWECSRPETRADYEAFRATLGDPDAFEVVELDDDGRVKA